MNVDVKSENKHNACLKKYQNSIILSDFTITNLSQDQMRHHRANG